MCLIEWIYKKAIIVRSLYDTQSIMIKIILSNKIEMTAKVLNWNFKNTTANDIIISFLSVW